MENDSLICSICTTKKANYTCPRCSINYCSLTCYRDRRHGKCSEKFYRECCEQAISSLRSDDEQHKQVKRMIEQEEQIKLECEENTHEDERSEDEESSDEEDEVDLSQRLKGVDLTSDNVDVDQIWKCLSAEEKRDFHRQIATGSIYSSVPIWTPWWHSAAKKLVKSFPDDFIDTEEPTKIAKPLAELLSKQPHPSVAFAFAELLLGFAFVSRYFNGDHISDMNTEACDLLIKLVTCIQAPVQHETKQNKTRIIMATRPRAIVFTNFEEVLASFQSQLANNRLVCSHQLILLLSDDLRCLLKDKNIDRALCELGTMLEIVKHLKNRHDVQFVRRKVAFFHACAGKRDTASNEWCQANLPALTLAVEASICNQTVRIEAERVQQNPPIPPKPKTAGPNWRNIIRQDKRSVPVIEELHS